MAVFTVSLCFISRIDSFNASNVDMATKQAWCGEQRAVCDNNCKDNGTTGATTNTCDPTQFSYACVCSDGKSPDKSMYTMPIDYFKCTSDQQDCTQKCGAANQYCVTNCTGNCAATIVKTYTYKPAAATSTPSSATSPSSSSKSVPSSLLTPNYAIKSAPAITVAFSIVFLTSITTFLLRL